ncbi:MAG: hypothetical protein Q7R88_00945 [bacterium]|nr:hypothetical protein [bacterium]
MAEVANLDIRYRQCHDIIRMKITLSVRTLKGTHTFVGRLHVHTDPKQFFLDPTTFYGKWGAIPEGTHHELEIIEPPSDVLKKYALHVHASAKSENPFVCYPLPLPTLEKAIEIFRIWCVGAACTMDCGIDLNTVYSQTCQNRETLFFEVMRERYDVTAGQALLSQ